ncbi:unnamed protein product [Caenorhabditis angaria]|uniref:LRRCT domain-containing protein n=1 Tax=Caenorhabditis angaria TaxID=860376 RepID=A0A9P1IM69_9PELO|nr:unnamed protein product [Caenorhabditis angaria]
MPRTIIFHVALALLILEFTNAQQLCTDLEKEMNAVAAERNATSPCNCYYDGVFNGVRGISIGCASAPVSQIFEALQTLNYTKVASLTIRDSLVNILTSNIFEMVQPQKLFIERCSLSIIRNNTIDSLGASLEQLSLRKNKLKKLEPTIFNGLKNVKSLDLSINKLQVIPQNVFNDLTNLEELVLNENEIFDIEDGAFEKLKNLKRLTINKNKLTEIRGDTFKGLENLETLQIRDNFITNIDWSGFSKLKKLKTLNLGNNQLTRIEIRGLENLQKLYLNHNLLETLKNVKIFGLTSLNVLSFDGNQIKSIEDMDLVGLKKSRNFESLSFASNNITFIGPRAFQYTRNLVALSLQNNLLADLTTNNTSFLKPLEKLAYLQLSNNNLTTIRSSELPRSLSHFAADHNSISEIEPKAFEGIALKRIYLNSNRLHFLHQNAFASFAPETIEAIDLSSNEWQCICKSTSEWLPRWLADAEESDVAEGPLGCLAIPNCGSDTADSSVEEIDGEETQRSKWITVAATFFAVLSVVILIAIVYLYYQDGGHQALTRARRADSDLHKLIENDNNTFENAAASNLTLVAPKAAGTPKKSVRFEDC